MTNQTTVLITLGTYSKKFKADIEISYCEGDYDTPSQSIVESINYFDIDGNNANDLINRYEAMYSIDVSELTLDKLI